MAFTLDWTLSDISTKHHPLEGMSGTCTPVYYLRKLADYWNTLVDFPLGEVIASNASCPQWILDLGVASNIPLSTTQSQYAGTYITYYFKNDPGLALASPRCRLFRFSINNGSAHFIVGYVAEASTAGSSAFSGTWGSQEYSYFLGSSALNALVSSSLYPAGDYPYVLTAWNSKSIVVQGLSSGNNRRGGCFIIMPEFTMYKIGLNQYTRNDGGTCTLIVRVDGTVISRMGGSEDYTADTGDTTPIISCGFPLKSMINGNVMLGNIRYESHSDTLGLSLVTEIIPDTYVMNEYHSGTSALSGSVSNSTDLRNCGRFITLNNKKYLIGGYPAYYGTYPNRMLIFETNQ